MTSKYLFWKLSSPCSTRLLHSRSSKIETQFPLFKTSRLDTIVSFRVRLECTHSNRNRSFNINYFIFLKTTLHLDGVCHTNLIKDLCLIYVYVFSPSWLIFHSSIIQNINGFFLQSKNRNHKLKIKGAR